MRRKRGSISCATGEQMQRWLARREGLGLTLRELSAVTGVAVGTLGRWACVTVRRIKSTRSSGKQVHPTAAPTTV